MINLLKRMIQQRREQPGQIRFDDDGKPIGIIGVDGHLIIMGHLLDGKTIIELEKIDWERVDIEEQDNGTTKL